MTKTKTDPHIHRAQENIKQAWRSLDELREHKINELRQIDSKLAALRPAADALFGKGSK